MNRLVRAAVLRCLLVLGLIVGCAAGALAQTSGEEPGLLYRGIVGQRHVTALLDVQGESLRGGHYSYDGQKDVIHFTEVRFFGTTAVLQDEDGNILHLHLRTAAGKGAPDWKDAGALEGTLVRGDLDLPVKLTRMEIGASGAR